MKKGLLVLSLALVAANAYGYKKWAQPDEQMPQHAYDYFLGGDDQTYYVLLSPEAKQVLKRMLENASQDEKLNAVIRRVRAQVKTPAGKEALIALRDMAQNDPELPAGVVLDGMFGDGKMMQKKQ
jgi:hypothetical protein